MTRSLFKSNSYFFISFCFLRQLFQLQLKDDPQWLAVRAQLTRSPSPSNFCGSLADGEFYTQNCPRCISDFLLENDFRTSRYIASLTPPPKVRRRTHFQEQVDWGKLTRFDSPPLLNNVQKTARLKKMGHP